MEHNLDNTVKAIKALVDMFKTERMVYLIITGLSSLVLIVVAIMMLVGDDASNNYLEITGLFAGSGGVLYTTGRLLKMFNDALALIRDVIESELNIKNNDDERGNPS